jgi:tetratricopeptide (TPR) repeat protein
MSLAPGRSSFAPLLPLALLVLALLSWGQPVAAQSTTAQARALFAEGRKLMQKEKYEEACPKFEESLRLDEGMGTQFNLAHCWEKIGRTASAWGLFMDVAAAANASGQKKRASAARERATALEPKLARLRIIVENPTPDLTVTHSGEELGRAAWDTDMPVDPGTHLIEAKAAGKHDWSQVVLVTTPGETTTLTIPTLEDIVVEKPKPPVEATAEQEPPAAEEDRGGGISTGRLVTTIGLAAVGAAGIAAGTLFGLEANSETAAAKQLCIGNGGSVCNRDQADPNFDNGVTEQKELEQHRKNADQAALLGYIGFGVGAAALVGSAVVLLTAPPSSERSEQAKLEPRFDLTPTLAPGLVAATLRGTF